MVICHTAFQTTSYTARYVNICGGNASAIQHRVVHRPSSGCKVRPLLWWSMLLRGYGDRSANRRRENKELNRIVYCDAICIVSNKISMPGNIDALKGNMVLGQYCNNSIGPILWYIMLGTRLLSWLDQHFISVISILRTHVWVMFP